MTFIHALARFARAANIRRANRDGSRPWSDFETRRKRQTLCRNRNCRAVLHQLQIGRSAFAVLSNLSLKANCLALAEARQSATFDGRDVNKHIWSAVVTGNKSITLLGVEPLYCSGSHEHAFNGVDGMRIITRKSFCG